MLRLYLKFDLYRISVYSGFGLDKFHYMQYNQFQLTLNKETSRQSDPLCLCSIRKPVGKVIPYVFAL